MRHKSFSNQMLMSVADQSDCLMALRLIGKSEQPQGSESRIR
nr:MAG TPA: hypothetical protein [Caudoviricetes sp.]